MHIVSAYISGSHGRRPMAPWASDQSFSTQWNMVREAESHGGPEGHFSLHACTRTEIPRNAVSHTKAFKRTFLAAPARSARSGPD